MKNNNIIKLAQMAADTLNTFNEDLLDVKKYIKILNKIKKKIQKVDNETHPTHEDWKSLFIIFQDKIDYLEQQNIRPEFNMNENLDVIESAKTLVHLNFETLSEIKDLIKDATNLASKLSRDLYLDFHLPYDIIQQHMENISDVLNYSLKRKKAANSSTETPYAENIDSNEYQAINENVKNIATTFVKHLKKWKENYINDININNKYFTEFILDDLEYSISTNIITNSSFKNSKNLVKTSQQISSFEEKLIQEIIENNDKNKINEFVNEYKSNFIDYFLPFIKEKINNINENLLNADFLSSIYHIKNYYNNVLKNALESSSEVVANQTNQGIIPLSDAIQQFRQFENNYYQKISDIPPIENLENPGDPFNLLTVFNVLNAAVDALRNSLESSSGAKEIFVLKKYASPAPAPDIKLQQIELLEQFLIQFKNLSPHVIHLGQSGTIFPQYVNEITKLIIRLKNEIKNKELFGRISPEVFKASVNQIVNHINKYTPAIKQYKIEYTALEPNINTIIQTIHNFIQQQNVQFDEAMTPRNNQNFSQMITKLENERQKVIKNAQRAKSLEDSYDMAISKLLLEESNMRLNPVGANDAIAGLKKTASLETIWRFLRGLFGQGIKDIDVQNFVDSQIINLNTKFDNFIKNLDIESEKNYNNVVDNLQGLKEHPLSQISFNLIPSQIRVEDVSMSESSSSTGGGGRGPSGGGRNANVIKVLRNYPPDMTNSEIQSSLLS